MASDSVQYIGAIPSNHISKMLTSLIYKLKENKGFAGDAADVTSSDLNAQADALSVFDWRGYSKPAVENLQDSKALMASRADQHGHFSPSDESDWTMLQPLHDLSTDPLADSSLDAFINLDIFLAGDPSFLDEEGSSVLPVVPDQAELKPVIDLPLLNQPIDVEASEPVAVTDSFIAPKPTTSAVKSRKRKAQKESSATKPVKTSMFEIPLSENVVSTTTSVVDAQQDHDYSTKRQKMAPTDEKAQLKNKGALKLTSGTVSKETKSSESAALEIEEHLMNDKHAIRRIKNNVASKRSREQRKQKFAELDEEAEYLVVENERLKNKIVELEKLAKDMKAVLVAKMAGK